jgi:cbb3-type cytochrome c oxidase CcoQ subunit
MYAYYQEVIPYIYTGLLFLSICTLYYYIWYMYKNDKNGNTDYENLSNLVLDDSIDAPVINTSKKNKNK